MLRKVNTSFTQMGETAATISPCANQGSLKATPHVCPLRQYSRVPSTMSNATPTTSPACRADPYLGPVELLLCLVSPLYIPHPCTVSEKASSRLRGDGLHTPILRSCPLLMKISKQYLPPAVKISVPTVVLKPLPYLDVQTNPQSSRVSLLLVFSGFQLNSAEQGEDYARRSHQGR